jgi:hypothetical protein
MDRALPPEKEKVMQPEIIAPIFIVGCQRSGTTVFYRKFALHSDLATITRTTRRAPNNLLLMRLFMLFRSSEKNLKPIGGEVWSKFAPSDSDMLHAVDVTPRMREYYHTLIRNHLVLFKKKRFLNKSPSNSARIGFLNEIFPDAFFIHLIRDGRAVTHSLSRGRKRHDRYSGVKFSGWQAVMEKPLVEGCAYQWKRTVEYILDAVQILPPERFIQIRYEDFVDQPMVVMQTIGTKCGLDWDDALLHQVAQGLKSRNYKWSENFSRPEMDLLNAMLGDFMGRFGYEV